MAERVLLKAGGHGLDEVKDGDAVAERRDYRVAVLCE